MIVRSETNLVFSRLSSRLWEVVGSRGDTYHLALSDSGLTCSCPGYVAHHHCYHVAELVESIKEDINMYVTLQEKEKQRYPAQTLQEHYKTLFALGYNPTDEDEEEDANHSSHPVRQRSANHSQPQNHMYNFPDEIAKLSRQILRLDREIRYLGERVNSALNAIERVIAFDVELKNDAQRKAKRTELMDVDTDYLESLANLRTAQDKRAELEIDLLLLRNQFSVWKLERREAIALIEMEVA